MGGVTQIQKYQENAIWLKGHRRKTSLFLMSVTYHSGKLNWYLFLMIHWCIGGTFHSMQFMMWFRHLLSMNFWTPQFDYFRCIFYNLQETSTLHSNIYFSGSIWTIGCTEYFWSQICTLVYSHTHTPLAAVSWDCFIKKLFHATYGDDFLFF